MTRIAIFCDGTWNSPHLDEVTNVRKLYEALESDPVRGQIAAYFPGIGVNPDYLGRFRKFINKYGGGAFGWGLDAKVKEAYKFICDVYRDGDEIYLFGFSRGAFTARSVAGMIRKCGLVNDATPGGINRAFQLYRKRGVRNAPDKPHIHAARRALSPEFATSQADLTMRDDNSKIVHVAYVGVWDTVGARGVPVALLGPIAALWNNQYKFHDMVLSSLVRSARHALAVDERRLLYVPAKWENLPRLNDGESGPLRPYQQMWFVGDHGTVGGSGKAQPLASIALDWVFRGAKRLTLKPDAQVPLVPADSLAPAPELDPKRGLLSRWRDGPHHERHIHISVRERLLGLSSYRPKSLWRIFGETL